MRKTLIFCSILLFFLVNQPSTTYAQLKKSFFEHSVSNENPYGSYNPDAPEKIKEFAPLIGSSQCKSVQRNQDGSWQDTTNMIWEFRYIFNGQAIQDFSWKQNGNYSSSVRQFNPDSSLWVVTYFSAQTPSLSPSTWTGNLVEGKIVLERPQKAPNGLDGYSRLTFYDISDEAFKWIGEWVSKNGSFQYPFWKISCQKAP